MYSSNIAELNRMRYFRGNKSISSIKHLLIVFYKDTMENEDMTIIREFINFLKFEISKLKENMEKLGFTDGLVCLSNHYGYEKEYHTYFGDLQGNIFAKYTGRNTMAIEGSTWDKTVSETKTYETGIKKVKGDYINKYILPKLNKKIEELKGLNKDLNFYNTLLDSIYLGLDCNEFEDLINNL